MNGDITEHIYLKIGQNNQLSNFGVSAIKKKGGATPKSHQIGLKIFGKSLLSDVIPKSLTEHKLSKLLFFWDPYRYNILAWP